MPGMAGLAARFPFALMLSPARPLLAGQSVGGGGLGGVGGVAPAERQLAFHFRDLLFGVRDLLLALGNPLFALGYLTAEILNLSLQPLILPL